MMLLPLKSFDLCLQWSKSKKSFQNLSKLKDLPYMKAKMPIFITFDVQKLSYFMFWPIFKEWNISNLHFGFWKELLTLIFETFQIDQIPNAILENNKFTKSMHHFLLQIQSSSTVIQSEYYLDGLWPLLFCKQFHTFLIEIIPTFKKRTLK